MSEKKAFDMRLHSLLQIGIFENSEINEIHLIGCEFFSNFEKYLAKCSSSGLTKLQLNDVCTSIENVLRAGADFWECLRGLAQKKNLQIEPSSNFLSTAQSILKSHKKPTAIVLRQLYIEKNLPVSGYMASRVDLKEKKVDWPAASAGIILLALAAISVFYLKVSDGIQYLLVRVLISLGAGLILSAFAKSHITLNYKHKGIAITALGAAATFLLIYFSNPADVPKFNNTVTQEKNTPH
ncbi:hypothetical protein [Massilia aquatica]|uniref:Uncharacterized protein n=1 Tax=Massilia aquatica TaxID=2609000 RepID=A0ABX0LUP9_9BURK|nr:hypothetical protein [Massilia aquatica]NHZ38579.1 hypothetical protein [Massilia aquatica]